MNWKYILLGLLALLILVPTLLYVSSIDWARTHSKRVEALPLLTKTDNTGQYRLKVGSNEFLVRVAGLQNTGPNLVLLHGFPESSIMWEALLKQASEAGYRVLAFDQRGYSPGARPDDIADYQIDKLTADVLAVADQVGFDTFHLVGHDWGAVVGWVVTMNQPGRVRSWSALSIPHIAAFLKGVLNDTVQQKRSSYISFFKRPYLSEALFTYGGQRTMKKLLASLPAHHRAEYLSILAEPGAMTAALNWYRALDIEKLVATKQLNRPITRPTLFIWGTKDGAIAPSVIPTQRPYITGPYQEIRLEAGHALIQEKEAEVVDAIMAHIRLF